MGVAETIGEILFPLTFHAESQVFLSAHREFISTITYAGWGIHLSRRGGAQGREKELEGQLGREMKDDESLMVEGRTVRRGDLK